MRSDIPETIGRYRVRAIIAQTPMVTVYEAWDEKMSRKVAIKTLRRDADVPHDALVRFVLTARAAGRLIHRNIVTIYDYAEEDDLAYFVMEFVDGMVLRTALRSGALSIGRAVGILRDVLEALSYSHAAGIIHRDLKPGNIILSKSEGAKLTDFGGVRPDHVLRTQNGTLVGTPAYMAPEQILGQPVDARTDIYAAGAVLYEMLTGDPPFRGSRTEIMHAVVNDLPLLPSRVTPTVPVVFDAIIRQAMARRREDRFQSAREFLSALDHYEIDQTVLRRPEPVQRTWTVRKEPKRRRIGSLVMGSLGALLVLASGFAAVDLIEHPGTPPASKPVPQTVSAVLPKPAPVVAILDRTPETVVPEPSAPLPEPEKIAAVVPPVPVHEPKIAHLAAQDHTVRTLLRHLRRRSDPSASVAQTPPPEIAQTDMRPTAIDKCWTASGSSIGIAYSCMPDGGDLVRLTVIGVIAGGKAEMSGVQVGDVIVGVDGHSGRDPSALEFLARSVHELDVMRGGRVYRLRIP